MCLLSFFLVFFSRDGRAHLRPFRTPKKNVSLYMRGEDTKPMFDAVLYNCFLLGCTLGLVMNYPKVIHAYDSRDVVRSKFIDNDRCYRFKPRVVTCGWNQGFPFVGFL